MVKSFSPSTIWFLWSFMLQSYKKFNNIECRMKKKIKKVQLELQLD